MASIQEIKNEMYDWFGFDLTDDQIHQFLTDNPKCIYFDTVERDTCANYFALKITDMRWPYNGQSEEYKNEFFKMLRLNASAMGYKWDEA